MIAIFVTNPPNGKVVHFVPECQVINRGFSRNYFLLAKLHEWYTFARNKWYTLNRNSGTLWIGIIRYGMDEKLSLLKELIATSSNLEEFGNNEKAKAAGLSFNNGNLFLMFPFCPCPMLAEIERLDNKTWCQCTTGYSKVLFEKAFGCEVDVELLKSVKAGDDICLMKITPLNVVKF